MYKRFTNQIHKKSSIILWIFIVFYIVLFVFLSFKKYYNFSYNAFDLAIFSQVFYNTLHGHLFDMTVNLNNYLADHFTPIIFLLLPFYALWQSPQNLLIIQTIFLALAAWPLYLIAKLVIKDSAWALVPALTWLLNPVVNSTNIAEFHLVTLVPFFIFFTFYFYRQKKFKTYFLFFIISLLIREDVSFVLVAFAFLSFIDKRSLKWSISSFVLPIFYFVLAYSIISYFSPNDNSKFLIYYSWLGGDSFLTIIWSWLSHPLSVISHIISPMNLFSLVILFSPTLFLPFTRPKYLVFMLLPLLQISMTGKGLDFNVYARHYGMLFVPAIFIALVFSLKKIKNREKFKFSNIVYRNVAIFKLIFLFTVLYFFIFLSPVKNVFAYQEDKTIVELKNQAVDFIGSDSKVTAEASFLQTLSNRRILYPLFYSYLGKTQFAYDDFDMPKVDYILVDYSNFLSFVVTRHIDYLFKDTDSQAPKHWRNVLAGYTLISAKDNIYIWQDRDKADKPALPFYEISKKTDPLSENKFLVNWQINNISDQQALKLDLSKAGEYDAQEFLVRFYKENSYFDIPLDYGILPISEWSDDQLVSFYYYPDKQVKSFQIFSWSGDNLVSPIANAMVGKKLESKTDKISI